MSEELKQLTQKRGQSKSKLTRFKTFIDSITEQTSITELKLRLAKLDGIFAEFEDIQTRIETLDSSDEQVGERDAFETLFYKVAAQGEDHIQCHTIQQQTVQGQAIFNSPTVSQASQVQVRLPSIELPSFSGHYEEWLSFSETFKALIHLNESLNDVQRFHYLRSALKGEAASIIESLELIASNYSVAWSLLENRYKNKRIIIQKHVKSLFELPSIEKDGGQSLRQLLDGSQKHIRALKALDQPTDSWDTLLLHIVTSKLSLSLQKEWELTTKPDTLPTFNELTEFMQRRCQILESSNSKSSQQKLNIPTFRAKQGNKSCFVVQQPNCRLCNGNHAVYQCQDLLKRPNDERYQKLRQAGLCFNCLKPGHTTTDCSSRKCKLCFKKHNTVLHPSASETPRRVGPSPKETNHKEKKEIVSAHTAVPDQTSHVLLSTAVVVVVGPTGKQLRCRALIDNGSQSCLMTEHVRQQLGLHKLSSADEVSGVNNIPINTNGKSAATVKSCITNYKVNLTFNVVPKITSNLPRENLNLTKFKIPNNVTLADPSFALTDRIDLLLGQEIFFDIICIGQIKTKGLPTLQKTRLGWIVGGKIEEEMSHNFNEQIGCFLTTTEKISSQLQQFWKIEEPSSKLHVTSEEKMCEDLYLQQTTREQGGRYCVQMPLKSNPIVLGTSKEIAEKRFLQTERRLQRDPILKEQYCTFMDEYEQMGHMKRVDDAVDQASPQYFLPHHPVLKDTSTTTKLRVVFDASAKTSSGLSLNDIQYVGPTVQSDLFSILLRFRLYTYVMTADLEKMYRQISIHESQRKLLQIFWRNDPSEPLQTFSMNTVTYGTASAPYLATRTLNQLVTDEGYSFPAASEAVKQDFYVDDLLTGTHTIEDGLKLQDELIQLLGKGQFNLRKWNSNSVELLNRLPDHLLEMKPQEFTSNQESTRKTLGLWWDSRNDVFHFKHSPLGDKAHRVNHLTKRILLSEIARLFDPLGLVSPVVVRAKVQLQELWKLQISWDEALPMSLYTEWKQFLYCLDKLNELTIPRQVTLTVPGNEYEVVGFSDASEKAYGCAVYLIHKDKSGNTKSSLICSKSRVSPLKTISIPRLELCAAILLAETVQNVIQALCLTITKTTYFTDSTVVLAWINSEPARWTTFVANRVSKIQSITSAEDWQHVKTNENPADLVSRGAKAETLAKNSLWWEGPAWLAKNGGSWPCTTLKFPSKIPEEKSIKIQTFLVQEHENFTLNRLINRFSSFGKICRILALSFRFIKNLKTKPEINQDDIEDECLRPSELRHARNFILRYVQKQGFNFELHLLKKKKSICHGQSSRILSLAPFLDEDGLIRVGGRLQKSKLNFDEKHPILLPKDHKITESIIREEHLRNMHCGPQMLLYSVRQQYWPVNGREITRKITRQCIRCFKARPKVAQQMMGQLPENRVNPGRTFLHTGVDYCGPFYVKHSRRRGARTTKCYAAVFVCLATKALHIELVSDLTTDAFIAALRRFVSRRGVPLEVHSDNGKTFVGAKRELRELQDFLTNEANTVVKKASEEGVSWKFIPPYSPHMGGIWEAAVKSLKHHLKRIVGAAALTFEEMATVLCQIEAVLNSRPLTPLSNDPCDLNVLSPAHFLTGGSLKALPEPSLMHLPESRLSRWQRLQQLVQHFWARWSSEYLSNLQQRKKWTKQTQNISVGSLVLLKEDNTPPLSWCIGRVTKLHSGSDGLTRVVRVKTSLGEVTRSVSKICPLPIDT